MKQIRGIRGWSCLRTVGWIAAVGFCCAYGAPSQAALFSKTIEAGDWLMGRPEAQRMIEDGVLGSTLSETTTFVAYLTGNKGEKVALMEGHQLVFRYAISFDGPVPESASLRVGAFDTDRTPHDRITGFRESMDSGGWISSFQADTFRSSLGYASWIDATTAGSAVTIRRRQGEDDNGLINTWRRFSTLAESASLSSSLAADTIYYGVVEITHHGQRAMSHRAALWRGGPEEETGIHLYDLTTGITQTGQETDQFDMVIIHLNSTWDRVQIHSAHVEVIDTMEDDTPPSPDPMTWAVEPVAISWSDVSMTATTAVDDRYDVEYWFENRVTGQNSGWQSGTVWTNSGLDPETEYVYRVKARDTSPNHNETAWSVDAEAVTLKRFTLDLSVRDTLGGWMEVNETNRVEVTVANTGNELIENALTTLTLPDGVTQVASDALPQNIEPGDSITQTYDLTATAEGDYTVTARVTADGVVDLPPPEEHLIRVRERPGPYSDYHKAGNEVALHDRLSWVEEAVPGATDRAIFSLGGDRDWVTDLGSDLIWRGIALLNNPARWIITGSHTLSIGEAGIDLSGAQSDLRVESPLNLVATQTWAVPAGRLVDLPAEVILSHGHSWIKEGAGTISLSNPFNWMEGMILLRDGILSVSGEEPLGTGKVRMEGGALAAPQGALLPNPMELAGTAEVANTAELTLHGILSGPGALRKKEQGVLLLTGDNTYSGGTDVHSGTIELGHRKALGNGEVVLSNGAVLQSHPGAFSRNEFGMPNPVVLDGNATVATSGTTIRDLFRIDGPIRGDGRLTVSGRMVYLYGNNSFRGGLELGQTFWLRVAGPQSLGTGPILVADATRLLAFNQGGTVPNRIILDNRLRLDLNNQALVLAGPLQGPGDLNLQDSGGTLVLSGDNSAWSGNLVNIRGATTIRVQSPTALGVGGSEMNFGGTTGAVVFEINENLPGGIPHTITMATTYNDGTGAEDPVEFRVNRDTVFHGSLVDGSTENRAGIVKSGPARMTLNGNATHSGPTRVLEGILTVNGWHASELEVAGGTILEGSGTVHAVSLKPGATLRLTEDAMRFNRSPHIASGARIELHIADRTAPSALVGSGQFRLELAGTLVLDFLGSDVQVGDTLHILRGWTRLIDRGVEIQRINLHPGLVLNAERLFIDGTVSIEAGAVVEPPLLPGDRVKENNTLGLNDPSSWVGEEIPGPQHRAVFNNRVFQPLTTAAGVDHSWRGIALVSNVVDWTISGPGSLTLGSGGVDLSKAEGDLEIQAATTLPAPQTWEIGADRTARVSGNFTVPEGVEWDKTGEGKLSFSGGSTVRQMAGTLCVSNGTLEVSGGYHRLDGLLIEVKDNPLGTATLRFADQTVLSTGSTAAGLDNPLHLEGMVQVRAGQNMLLKGLVSGPGGLIHSGTGIVRLDAPNTFEGGTIVDSGSTLEFTHFRAFGQGPVVLREGATLHGWLPFGDSNPDTRRIGNNVVLEGMANVENLATQNNFSITFAGCISGPGGLRASLRGTSRDIILRSNNTFEGDLEIRNLWGSSVLYASDPSGLGRGDIVCLSPDARLGFNQSGGRIVNRINLMAGSMNFINRADTTVEFAGPIFGSGSISLINRPGTIRLSGDNRNWSGGISGIGSFNVRRGVKKLIVDHPYALGTGDVVLGGHTRLPNVVEIHTRAPVVTTNHLFAADSGPEKERNDLFMISKDSVFGRLDGVPAHQGLDKTGPGRMTLTAQGNYPSPFNVRGGELKLETGAGFPGKTTIFPGAGLVADNARTGPIRTRSGGAIEVKGGGLRVEGGALTLEGDARMTLRPSPAQAAPGYIPLLAGDGTRDLSLSGTLLVDFSAIDPAPVAGDVVALFGSWNRMVNNGVTVLASGLDDFMTLEPSTLFSDGRVRVVGGGRLGSQELSIRVTSGGTASASVQVRNPGSETRYFTLQPGAEWPSWLSATPASRTRLNPGAQATVSVTANAAGLPAGTHRFLLPVVWEHGVTDFILVTVQVEGPSLGVAPGALTLPVVEGTTGEGTVDLINNGTLPVSYRIRRVLAEHEIYTQPAADVPWITVSPTAQTEITSFTSGRSTPRAIGFGFPFFGATETEVSVGIDGTLWFGGKPAIRVFSNQLSYQSGLSKITAKPEADRLIVTWSKVVQPDNAQQTFQAVLHRDGRIDLRYHTIVANSAWQSALIGLHGPTQWFPAQVPDPLQGRTIRFARDGQIARISIPDISGTVAAGTNKTLTVTGDATGLSAGASRTALFAVDYDGGITGTAGEVQVTMEVVAAAGDPVGGELADPVIAFDSDDELTIVLHAPRCTQDGGRHLSWSVHPGYQTYGTGGQYRVQWTTNLASGIWIDRATVTNGVEYTDTGEMPGPVIFYRVIKQ